MPNLIETYNKHNQPTGHRLTIDQALKRGSWCRGAHVVICTTSGEVLIQKRSTNMVMHPGQLDISAGGFVDAGETPEQAAVREVREELGLTITERDLQFIKIYRQNHYWPKLHKQNRTFSYAFMVMLPEHPDVSNVQQSEVEWARFISLRQAKQLVRRKRLKSLGRLEPKRRIYRDAVRLIEQTVTSRAIQ